MLVTKELAEKNGKEFKTETGIHRYYFNKHQIKKMTGLECNCKDKVFFDVYTEMLHAPKLSDFNQLKGVENLTRAKN